MSSTMKIILTVLVTGLLVGGLTYWAVNSKATTDKAALQTQIDTLNKKVADTTPATTSTTTTTTTPSTITSDSTADWKTYTNSTYYYSFKYPTTWEVTKVTPGSSNSYLLSWQGVNPISHREDYLASVRVSPKSVTDEVASAKAVILANQQEVVSSDVVTFNTYSATALKMKNKASGEIFTTYYISHLGNTYIVDGTSTASEANDKIANAVVGAFSFTK